MNKPVPLSDSLPFLDWARSQRIRSHHAPHVSPPWAAYVGRRDLTQYLDIHGEEGFVFGDTRAQAILLACERWHIEVPEQFRYCDSEEQYISPVRSEK